MLGSYELDLMLDSLDIDIRVLSQNLEKDSRKALEIFLDKKYFQKIEYGNFLDFKRKNRPEGYILNLRREYKGLKWEVEIWFVSEDNFNQSLRELDLIKEKLNSSKKEEILKLKEKRFLEGKDKNDLSSYEIYKKVLGF